MAIKLCDNNRAKTDSLLECLRLGVASLSDGAIHDENASVRFNSLLYLNHLIEESSLLSMSTRRVDDDDLVVVFSKVVYTCFCNFYGVCLLLVTVERTLDLSSIHLQLGERSSTESVSADNSDFPALLHIVICKLRACSRFACSLEANKHYNIWFATLVLIRLVA